MPTTTDQGLLDFVRPILKRHEGTRFHVYVDTKGLRTIGTGFNLEQPGARAICEQCGADYDALLNGTKDLTPEQNDFILNHFIISTIEWLTKIFPAFSTYSIPRQAALIDMGFMGEHSFREFIHLIAAVKAGLWSMAGDEAVTSKWARDVGPTRSHDVVALFNTEEA